MTTGETELIHFIQNIIIFIQFKNKALFLDRDGVINNKEDNKKCKYRIKKLNLFFFAIIKKPKQFSFIVSQPRSEQKLMEEVWV